MENSSQIRNFSISGYADFEYCFFDGEQFVIHDYNEIDKLIQQIDTNKTSSLSTNFIKIKLDSIFKIKYFNSKTVNDYDTEEKTLLKIYYRDSKNKNKKISFCCESQSTLNLFVKEILKVNKLSCYQDKEIVVGPLLKKIRDLIILILLTYSCARYSSNLDSYFPDEKINNSNFLENIFNYTLQPVAYFLGPIPIIIIGCILSLVILNYMIIRIKKPYEIIICKI